MAKGPKVTKRSTPDDELTALAARPDVDAATMRQIETEIRNVRAGAAGERDATYEIEFYLGSEVSWG